MRVALWVVAAAAAALLGGSATSVPMVAQLCGVVFGVLLSYWYDRAERRALYLQTQEAVGQMLGACRLLVEAEKAQREALQQEAEHYRRLYLQKVEQR